MSLPSSSLTSLKLSVSKGSPPNVSTYEQDIPLSDVVIGSNSIIIPNDLSIVTAFETSAPGTSFSHSIKAHHANGLSVVTTNGAPDFVPFPLPTPPIVLDANGVTIKYTGPALTSTTTPTFIQANPRGTGTEWFAVVDDSFKQKILDYAKNDSAAVATFTPPGQSSPVIFNNIVTTLMTDMSNLFIGALVFNQPIGSWDVLNVTNMNSMFSFAQLFNQDISNWDVSNVTIMNSMFSYTELFNQPIGSWDVSKVTSMGSMFSGARKFNQPIGSWDVSKVTIMIAMFSGAYQFNQDISNWDVSNVIHMYNMFRDTLFFNQPIGSWDVSKANSMRYMFSGNYSFNYPLNNWNVSNVTNMSFMFSNASVFNQDISNWNVSNVTNMNSMFSYALAFNQNISNWNVSSVSPKPPSNFSYSSPLTIAYSPVWV